MASYASATEHQLTIAPGEVLHYWTLGDRFAPVEPSDFNSQAKGSPRPVLIMQHGMRDVGRCMLPIAATLSNHFYCVLPDLRGHGKSFSPGSYAIQHFLMDLRRLHQTLDAPRIHLLGHSLGGHITARYAGLYADEVESLVVVEGLGPPRWEMPVTGEFDRIAAALDGAITTANYAANPRVIPNLEEATRRLLQNNPRLNENWALQLARWGTKERSNGQGLQWAFDPRAQEVFLGVSDLRNFDYWRAIKARTLVVTGDLGHTYWRTRFATEGYSGRFSDAELQERLDALSSQNHRAEHTEIAGAGHQVHYDQPEALAQVTRQFLTPLLQSDHPPN